MTLLMYVVYDHPADHPQGFVVRPLAITRVSSTEVDTHAREILGVRPTIDEARLLIPAGLHCFPRSPKDDPVIVETWL